MVFESIVVELINRYLGQFVENLDTSQLKIGIWGGDVVLNNLNIKESALDDLDLPVKIRAGHIGKLTLKIPWKNLYTAPVIAELDGIYALAVPNIAINYDEAKDNKLGQEEKQNRLKKIEEIKKLEAEKDKPKDPQQASFVEKLATQVIKNLQIRVSNIHIRYEDTYTNPQRPVSIGVTLQQLLFQTTDENWKETVIKEAVVQIYKLIRLDSLAVYWNSKADMIQGLNSAAILEEMKSILEESKLNESAKPTKNHKLHYIFRPISAVAHLRLHTKPELNQFTIPKMFLTLVFDEIGVVLSKDQYDDVLEMLESMDRMALLSKYKKTRPALPYKGNATKWWHHAYAAVLEHTVQRRRLMWAWVHMKHCRDSMRRYTKLYVKVLEGKKLGGAEQTDFAQCEKDLDLFNIVMCRNQAEIKAKKEEAKRLEEKSTSGWFGGWFGGGKKKPKEDAQAKENIGNKFQEEFNADEKAKLYQAIGYDESAPDPTLPIEFVAVRLVTKWNKLSLTLLHTNDSQLLRLSLNEICASFGQRPAANAIRLDAKIERLRVAGSPRKDYMPKLISSVSAAGEDSASLLTVAVETSPLDGQCDSRIRVNSNALEVIYDAITVNGMASFFKPPESVRLKNFSEAAMAKYNVIKTQTATGMLHAMEERKYADIEVHLMPSYIIMPETGELKKDVNMLLLNLGAFNIGSERNKMEGADITKLSKEQVEDFAYDKFNISLENVQLLFVQPGDVWQDPNRLASSPLYILRPLTINLTLEKCLFSQDPLLPQIRIGGELKLISVTVSDSKLVKLMKLAASIPLPQSPPETEEQALLEQKTPLESADVRLEADITKAAMRTQLANPQMTSEYVNFTAVAVSFLVKEICVQVMETKQEEEVPLLKLVLNRLGANLKQRTFDMTVDMYLGTIFLQHLQFKASKGIQSQLAKLDVVTGEVVNIINTPAEMDEESLLTVNYLQADKRGPDFKTTYNSTAQSMTVQFSTLDVLLHHGVLISLLEFAKKLEPPPAPALTPVPEVTQTRRLSTISSMSVKSDGDIPLRKETDVFNLRVRAFVENIQVGLCTERTLIMHSKVEGIEVGATMQKGKMGVTALLRRLELTDPDPLTKHHKILSVSGSEVLSFQLTMYENGTKGGQFDQVDQLDMDVFLKMGRARVVFVNKFINTLSSFFATFAMAKAKLDEAALALQEAGKDVAKNLKENEPRIKINVSLKAPLVLVPQSSRSQDVLLVNLGDISVSNEFSFIKSNTALTPTKGMALIKEGMTIVLSNLRVSRGMVDAEGGIKAEITILDPLTFKIDLHRNCSRAWYHGIPDIQVKAVLDCVVVRLSQEDLTMAMHLLEENLNETSVEVQEMQSVVTWPGGDSVDVRKSMAANGEHKDPSPRKMTLAAIEEEPYCMVKLDFELVSIQVELFKGSSHLDSGQNIQHVEEKMMAQLMLRKMGVNFDLQSNNAMNALVYLVDFTLDDCRMEKRGGITEMIQRANISKKSGQEKPPMFVDLKFTQDPDENKSVVLNICSLRICLCMDFLMRLSEFFTKAMPQAKPAGAANANGDHRESRAPSLNPPLPPKEPPPMKGSLDVVLRLEQPEIYLIEDQMNKQTNSLIVDVGIDFRLRMTPDVLSITGSVNNLSLVSCVFGNMDTRQNVLKPCTIDVIGNSPHNRDHHIDVTVSDIVFSISPSTIRLLTAVMSGLSAQPEDEVVESKLEDFSNIWLKKQLDDCAYWFLHSVLEDIGTAVDLPEDTVAELTEPERGEQADEKLMISAPLMAIKLEGGVGHRTVPLLIVEASFSGQVHNWSSQLYVESTLGVEVAYYNERLGVWEPILEPVIDQDNNHTRKWELTTEVVKTDTLLPAGDEEDTAVLLPPKMTITVVGSDPLQLVVTKTCLDVLANLGKAFNEAYQLHAFEGQMGVKIIPYVFRNMTGEDMNLNVDPSLQVIKKENQREDDLFSNLTELSMDTSESSKEFSTQTSFIEAAIKKDDKKLSFKLSDDQDLKELHVKQAKKCCFPLRKKSSSGDAYQLVCEIEASIGQTVTSFCSILQIHNHLEVPMEVFFHGSQGMASCGEVNPGQTFHVPLEAVYCTTGEIFFKPISNDLGVSMSKQCIKWKGLNEGSKLKEISCEPESVEHLTYFFNVQAEFEEIYLEETDDKNCRLITFHLHPTVILHNLMPFAVQFMLAGMAQPETLESGQHIPLTSASVNHCTLELLIPQYRGLQWSGKKQVKLDVPELSVWQFEASDDGKSVTMDLGLHSKQQSGSFDLSLYSPYWIINMSEQTLALKEDDKEAPVISNPDNKSIMMFYFRDKPLFSTGKRKVQLKIGDGEWSDKFSLDTVGSNGNVSSKNKQAGNTLEVGVKINLSASGLTKIVTFTPYYMMLNASTVTICVQEETSDEWFCINPGACQAYFPKTAMNKDKEIKVRAKVEGREGTTALFFLNKAHTSLLKLEDSYGGINVDCQVRESAMISTFKLYLPGMATALFVNHTSLSTVSIKQSGTPWETLELEPMTSQLYTWDSPTGKREIVWSCGKKKDAKSQLDQDNIEEFFAQDDVKVYLVSFLDGMQRVAMFTQDLALATMAQEAGELEQADQEINLKIRDMGFSLINNNIQQEVAYMGITSSGVIWEEKKKRFKAMKLKDCATLEHAYQKYLMELQAGKKRGASVSLENKMEVNFETMAMTKPRKCTIRRSFEDGLWMQYKSSPHSNQFHAKVNRLQFDNQLRHAVFGTVLSPLPPPKSVAAESVPKPFVEVSVMVRIHEHSQLQQIKYFKVLVQEMNLKVDQGFLNATLALFASGTELDRSQEAVDFEQDVGYSKRDLKEEAGLSIQQQKVSFYDYFHVSPIKVHLSFSLQGGEMSTALQANVLNVFLQSVGVVLTDIQDVVFKLGYFERNNSFYNPDQLTSEFTRHYTGQAIKQMYVLVLGLDVLGNPFGLLRGLSEGIEDLFYEPYQGAIQGPEEFAEGLALGVRSLFGHAVGGAAGAVSRITGTLGKGLAALTLDDDYQKKRREQLNKRPATAREGFARGGKGLVMGVFDGVTGIVRKPVEGAKQEGVSGFFKGMGKGLVGVVTRPTSGVVDFASSSLEGIRRITDMTEDIRRLRPPRRIYKDGIVRPYDLKEAQGYQLLLETEKGKYLESDEYVTHAKVKEDGKIVFIVTDKRVFLAKRGEIFGSWDTDWVLTYQEMKGAPKVSSRGIEIFIKEREKKKLFGSSSVRKDVHLADPKLAPVVVKAITDILTEQGLL